MYRPSIDEDTDTTRVCVLCGKTKLKTEFYKAGKYLRRQCKSCTEAGRNHDKVKAARRERKDYLKRYGLTLETYEEMVAERSNQCDICAEQMNPPHVDHDHATGKVRGLLCFSCNTGLGKFRDNTETLQQAINYLRRNA